jgi:hypothetical protein
MGCRISEVILDSSARRLRGLAGGNEFSQETRMIRSRKSGAPAWDREPLKTRSVAGVVFTPARGVIHPSFPLRGRWERNVKSDKQAPSPSLVSLHIASYGTRPRLPLMHGPRQSASRPSAHKCLLILKVAAGRHRRLAPNPASRSELERIGCWGLNSYPFQHRRKRPGAWFQDPGNRISSLAELSVFWGDFFRLGSCSGLSSPPFPTGRPWIGFGALEWCFWPAHCRC